MPAKQLGSKLRPMHIVYRFPFVDDFRFSLRDHEFYITVFVRVICASVCVCVCVRLFIVCFSSEIVYRLFILSIESEAERMKSIPRIRRDAIVYTKRILVHVANSNTCLLLKRST